MSSMQQNWKQAFGLVWIGQFFSLVSSSAVNFAIIIWLSLETGSAEVLAFAAIAGLLPQAIIGPIAGVFVDRWDRKRTMVLADAFVDLSTLAMALSFMLGNNSLAIIYLLLALRSVGSAFHMPAMQAAIPMLAPKDELLRIAGINQVIQSVSTIAGPVIGALLISFLPIGQVLLIDIAGALIAMATLFFVHIPQPEKKEPQSNGVKQVWGDIKQGLKDIQENKGLRWLFIYSIIVTFCVMPIAILFPLLTIQHYGGGKWEMSVIEVMWGVGMLVGGGLLGIFKPSWSKVVLINTSCIIIGLVLAMSGYISGDMFLFFVVLTVIGGIGVAVYNASFTTILQEQVAPDRLGRVFSMYFSLTVIPSIIGLLSTGFVAEVVGINLTFIILGLAISLVGVFSFFTPSLMLLSKKNN